MNRCTLLIALLISSQMIFAWGRTGHLIIGELADTYTTAKTKKAIADILGKESLSEAGTWLDDVMNDDKYSNFDNWHYVKIDEHLDHNSLIMIDQLSQILKDQNAAASDKLLAIRGLTHIVEDIHQPLHCGYIKDAGGNTAKVKWTDPPMKTNLHKAWDTDMIKMQNKSQADYVAYLKSGISDEQLMEWKKAVPEEWVKESRSYLDDVYKFEGKKLDKAYYEANIPTVDLRMRMSAVRLAVLFNNIFDPPTDG